MVREAKFFSRALYTKNASIHPRLYSYFMVLKSPLFTKAGSDCPLLMKGFTKLDQKTEMVEDQVEDELKVHFEQG